MSSLPEKLGEKKYSFLKFQFAILLSNNNHWQTRVGIWGVKMEWWLWRKPPKILYVSVKSIMLVTSTYFGILSFKHMSSIKEFSLKQPWIKPKSGDTCEAEQICEWHFSGTGRALDSHAVNTERTQKVLKYPVSSLPGKICHVYEWFSDPLWRHFSWWNYVGELKFFSCKNLIF